MTEKRDTRRAVLTGGAVLLGAAVVGSQGTAEAANGSPVLIGRSNVGSAETKLTNASTVPGLNVTSTNAAGGARAANLVAKGGYGAYIESATNHAASIWTKHKDRWSVFAVNDAVKGSGGAIRADGRRNVGLSAGTTNNDTTAITARNTAPSNGQWQERAIVATAGGGQTELAAWGFPSQAAIVSAGHHGVVGITDGQGGGLRAGVIGISRYDASVGVYAVGALPARAIRADGHSEFNGNVHVGGVLSKGAGAFRIDHPLDPANKYLSHSFVESPDMMNVYNGNVIADAKGEATVDLPEWFESLNQDFRYQLTPIGGAAPDLHVKAKVAKGRFGIAGAKPGQEVSWQLTGIRQDAFANAHRIPVEEAKPAKEKGTYLFPKGFGQPESAALSSIAGPVVTR